MTNNTKQNVPVIITAILAIVLLEGYALYQGIDGKVLTLAIGAVCALAGIRLGKYLQIRSLK